MNWFHEIFSRNFLKLWYPGSVFKLILPNLFFYLIIYITVDLIYIYWLKGNQDMVEIKEFYEMFCVFCKRFRQMIPINFLTGFYVTEVVRRYWDQFMTLPFPDRIALKVSTHVSGKVCKKVIQGPKYKQSFLKLILGRLYSQFKKNCDEVRQSFQRFGVSIGFSKSWS